MEKAVKRLLMVTLLVLLLLLIVIAVVITFVLRAANLPLDARLPSDVLLACVQQRYLAESPEGLVELTLLGRRTGNGKEYCVAETPEGGILWYDATGTLCKWSYGLINESRC